LTNELFEALSIELQISFVQVRRSNNIILSYSALEKIAVFLTAQLALANSCAILLPKS